MQQRIFFQMVPLVNTQIRGGSLMGRNTLVLAEDFLVYPGLDVTTLKNQTLTLWVTAFKMTAGTITRSSKEKVW